MEAKATSRANPVLLLPRIWLVPLALPADSSRPGGAVLVLATTLRALVRVLPLESFGGRSIRSVP